MTSKQRHEFDKQPRPPRFTGLHRGRYYFKGRRWLGSTNTIGQPGTDRPPFVFIQEGLDEAGQHSWGLVPKGLL